MGVERTRYYSIATLTRLAIASALAPILLLVACGLYFVVENVRQGELERLSRRADSIMSAVDRELKSFVKIAEALADSQEETARSSDGQLAARFRFASGVVGGRVILVDRTGYAAADSRGASGGLLTFPNEVRAKVFDEGRSAILDLGMESEGGQSPLRIGALAPIRSPDGSVRNAVAYFPPTDSMLRVLWDAAIPEGRLASILDRRDLIVARSSNHARFFGQLPSEGLRARFPDGKGMFQTVDLEGRPAMTAFVVSRETGWKVVLWMPLELMSAPGQQALGVLALATSGALLLSVLASHILGKTVRRPIEELVGAVAALGSNRPSRRRASWMTEANVIADALDKAASRLERRDRELAESTRIAVQNEDRYRHLVEGLRDVIVWEGDAQSPGFTFVSAAAERLLGHPASSWIKEPGFWAGLVHPDDRELAVASRGDLKRESGSEISYRMLAADGRTVWVRDSVFVDERERGGRVIRGLIVDITRWKEAVAALEANEERLRVATDAAGLGVFEWRLAEDRAVFENSRSYEIFGHAPDDGVLSGAAFLADYVEPEDREAFETAFRDGIGGRVAFNVTCRIRRKSDRVLRWIELAGNFLKDERGKPASLVGVIADITERKQSEEELLRSTSLLRAIADETSDCIYVKDTQSRIIFANPATVRVFGVSHDELLGQTGIRWKPKEDVDAIIANDHRIMESGIGETVEEAFNTPAGRRIFMSVKNPLRDRSGKTIGLIGVSRDITNRKQSEEQTRLLLQEVSHRAKNMLAVTQAIVRQTSRELDPAAFSERVTGRLAGLAASHDLLVDSDWLGVEIKALVVAQLAKCGVAIGPRMEIEGPDLRLRPGAAQTLGMALHELATNAVRFGALSGREGQVTLVWSSTSERGEEIFRMSWSEVGGPAVKAPEQKGFGYAAIVRMVEHGLDGDVTMEYKPTGVLWQVIAPVGNVVC